MGIGVNMGANELNELWQQRYGSADGLPPGLAEQGAQGGAADQGGQGAEPAAQAQDRLAPLLAQLMAHRSVRAYLDQPLPAHSLPAMLAAAQSAASSSNLQAFSVVAVQDPARKAALADCAGGQAHIRQAPLLLVWLADLSRLTRNAARQGLPAEANAYFEMFLVAAVDAALAAQNATLAAEAMGLGTVYIGAMRNQPQAVAQILALPPKVFALFGLCVGWPDTQRPAAIKPRLPQALVLHHETYAATDAAAAAHKSAHESAHESAQESAQEPTQEHALESAPPSDQEAALLAGYDAVMRRFQQSQGMATSGWAGPAAERVAGPGSLQRRHTLVAALQALGFGLR